MCAKLLQSCATLWDPLDHSLTGSFVHGILQAGILEWVAISFSRGSSQPRDWTCISCIGRLVLYHWATREALGKFGFSCKPEVLTFLLKLMTISYFLHWSSRSLLITTISFNFYFIYISWPGLFFSFTCFIFIYVF